MYVRRYKFKNAAMDELWQTFTEVGNVQSSLVFSRQWRQVQYLERFCERLSHRALNNSFSEETPNVFLLS